MRVAKLLLMLLTVSTLGCNNLPPDVPIDEECVKLSNGSLCLAPEPPEECVTTAEKNTCDFTVTPRNVPQRNIVIGGDEQSLGEYVVNAPKEGVSVGTSTFHVETRFFAPLLTRVTLHNSIGRIVAGPVEAERGEGGSQIVTFTDVVTYPEGGSSYSLETALHTEIANGTTFTVSFNPSKDWTNVQGQTTGNSIAVPDTLLTLGTVTAKKAALSISQSVNPPAHTVVAGSRGVFFAAFQFDTFGSSEDIRTHGFPLTLNPSPGAYADLSACQLFVFDGTTPLNTGVNIVNPNAWEETFTYDKPLVFLKDTITTLRLKCNISSSTPPGSTFTWRMSTEQINGVVAIGIASGIPVSATGVGVGGSTITIGVGSLSISTSPYSPPFTIIAAGSQDVNSGVHRLCAVNEGQRPQRVGLRLASGSPQSIVNVTLWENFGQKTLTQWGSSMFVGNDLTTTMFLTPGLRIEKDNCKDFTIRANLSNVGLGYSGTQGDIRIEVIPEETFAVGDSSAIVKEATGYTETHGFRMLKSFPTVVLEPLNATGLADGNFIQFKVMADWHGNIALRHMSFSIICTGLEIKDVALFAYSDPSYTTPIYGVAEGNLTGTIGLGESTSSVGLYFGLPPVTVPAGGAYYFRLKGSMSLKRITYSCATKLLGDPSFSSSTGAKNFALGTLNDVLGTTMSSFIWNTFGNTDDNDPHWTNGVEVLPANGLGMFRSN